MYIYILILIHLCHEASQQGYHHKIQPEWVMFLVPRISKLATVVPPGALWLRCPDFQGTQWSARATDFFSGTLGPSWFLQWTNHGNHEVNSHGAYGAYVLTPGLLDIGWYWNPWRSRSRALPSPTLKNLKIPKRRSIPKTGRSPRGVDPQEISRIPKVLAQHPMFYHYLPVETNFG